MRARFHQRLHIARRHRGAIDRLGARRHDEARARRDLAALAPRARPPPDRRACRCAGADERLVDPAAGDFADRPSCSPPRRAAPPAARWCRDRSCGAPCRRHRRLGIVGVNGFGLRAFTYSTSVSSGSKITNSADSSAPIVASVRRAFRLMLAMPGPPYSMFWLTCAPHLPAMGRKMSLADTPGRSLPVRS